MSSWTRAPSASSKWVEDVAMASIGNEPGSPKSFSLPLPVTQPSSTNPKVSILDRIGRSTVYSKGAKVTRKIKTIISAPSSDTVVRQSLGDIQLALDANTNNGLVEEITNVPVNASEDEVVDEVVVDRSWLNDMSKTSLKSKAESESEESSTDMLEDIPSSRRYVILVWIERLRRLWDHFFNPKFLDTHKEETYQREAWQHGKRLALWGSVFFIVNWVLGAALIAKPAVLADKIYYYGFAPCIALPLILLCAFNFPTRHSILFQGLLLIETWSWPFYQVLFGYLCGYTGKVYLFTCGTKDFSSTFYYTTALQTVALFGFNLKRFPALLGFIVFLIITGTLIIPDKISWLRNSVNFSVFQLFLMYMHYQREMSARHLFELRIELKDQFERTQKAQISKYRLTSYVFHEVRVPLNTALLAAQNMAASGTIAKSLELEFTALEGSLSMMSKVLNDVLDFNRMDSGKFESLSRPYAFHQVMRSMLLPLRLATNARNLELVTDLDMEIDEIARRAAYEALGEDHETIKKHMKEQPSGESYYGIVVGDETRLRQVVTNLASNACKFTPSGGKVTIRTRLVLPSASLHSNEGEKKPTPDPQSSRNSLTLQNVDQHNHEVASDTIQDRIVVRIEVGDTGSGIRPQDMVQSKLFSAFNQTEQGRQQGGKGTGLGLALVRLIVQLSGGRLGVRSKAGEGSTFWVELPLGIGAKAMLAAEDNSVISSPARNFSSNTLRQSTKTKHRRNSTQSTIDVVDAASQYATQPCSQSLRSKNILHRLMDQGGSVELNLANYDSHTTVPTRTIGDRSTGTDVPMAELAREESRRSNLTRDESHRSHRSHLARDECRRSDLTREESRRSNSSTSRIHPNPESDSLSGSLSNSIPSNSNQESDPNAASNFRATRSPRPTYVPLPSPASSISNFTPQGLLPPSPLANRAFPPPSPSTPSFTQPLNVLVVDDDSLTRTLMKRMLERMGCDVTTAENGDLALKLLLSQDPDGESSQTSSNSDLHTYFDSHARLKFNITFLDNQMPVLSGLKAVAKLRELGRKDFVVGVTGNALVSDQKEYLEAGVDHVLTKPVLERSLRNMLQLADDRRKALRS